MFQHERTTEPSNALFGARVANWCIYAVLAYPIVDYGLSLSFWHALELIWDKVDLLALAVIALVRYLRGVRPKASMWTKFAGWYVLLCTCMVLSGLLYPNIAIDGFSFDVEFIAFGLLMPFVADPRKMLNYLYCAVAVSIFIGLDGVVEYILKVPIPSNWTDVNEHVRTRVFSVLKSPAELGAHMELILPITFALWFVDTNRIRRIVYLVGGVCCLASFVVTFDRGSWMGFGIAILLVSIAYERRFLWILIPLCIAGYFVPAIHHRVTDLFHSVYFVKSAQGGRLMLWGQAFNEMAINPLFGVGLGHYGGTVATSHSYSLYSDNYYAKVLGESGLVGLVLFLAMQVSLVREFAQTVVRPSTGALRLLALGALAGMISILIHSFVENLFEYPATASFYFVLMNLFLVWGKARFAQSDGLKIVDQSVVI